MHGSREAKPPVRHMLIGAAKPGAGPPPIPVRFRIGVGLGTGKKKRFLSSLYTALRRRGNAHTHMIRITSVTVRADTALFVSDLRSTSVLFSVTTPCRVIHRSTQESVIGHMRVLSSSFKSALRRTFIGLRTLSFYV